MLVECQHLRRVYCINNYKSTARFVPVIGEPFFHKIKNLATNSFACKLLIDTDTAYQDAGIAIESLLVVGYLQHIITPATR